MLLDLPEDVQRTVGGFLVNAKFRSYPCAARTTDLLSASAASKALHEALGPVANDSTPVVAQRQRQWLEMRREASRRICIQDPKRLLQHLRNLWLLDSTSSAEFSGLLQEYGTEWLPPATIGELLAEPEYGEVVMSAVLRSVPLYRMSLDVALRALLAETKLPSAPTRPKPRP